MVFVYVFECVVMYDIDEFWVKYLIEFSEGFFEVLWYFDFGFVIWI